MHVALRHSGRLKLEYYALDPAIELTALPSKSVISRKLRN